MKRLENGPDNTAGHAAPRAEISIVKHSDNVIARNQELHAALKTKRMTIDKPFVLVNSDGQEITDRRPQQALIDKQLQEQENKLLATAHRHGEDTTEFSRRMNQFQARVSDRSEVIATYQQIQRLLEPSAPSLVSSKERATLARQILMQAAEPDMICQGHHQTCTITSLESVVYTKHPSKAAEMLADLALTGQFTASDGTSLKLDPHPRDYIQRYDLTPANERTYASELFQIASVNLHYQNTGYRYEQRHLTGPFKQDTGEDLFLDGKKVSDDPSIRPVSYREIENSITGANDRDPRLDNVLYFSKPEQIGPDAIENGARFFKTEQEFELHLRQLKETSGFPVVLTVNTANDPFVADDPTRVSDAGGWHAITVRDFLPGNPSKVYIDNPWGPKFSHHTDARAIPVHELYLSTFSPDKAAKLLQKDSNDATRKGKPDSFSEFEAIRLNWVAGRISNQSFVDQVRHEFRKFNADLDAHRCEKETAISAGRRLDDIVENIPERMAIQIQTEEYRKRFLSEKDFVHAITDFALHSRLPLQKITLAKYMTALSNWMILQDAIRQLPKDTQAALDKDVASPDKYMY